MEFDNYNSKEINIFTNEMKENAEQPKKKYWRYTWVFDLIDIFWVYSAKQVICENCQKANFTKNLFLWCGIKCANALLVSQW